MTLLLNFELVAPDAVPDPDDVAALLHERLYVEGEREISFTGSTTPTHDQVVKLIEFAAADVATRVGVEIPAEHWPEARYLASLRAAGLVETSYFPGQINDENRTAERQYLAMFLEGMPGFIERVRGPAAIRLA
jgi:hypothetical protein